jgi:hypothetical protein
VSVCGCIGAGTKWAGFEEEGRRCAYMCLCVGLLKSDEEEGCYTFEECVRLLRARCMHACGDNDNAAYAVPRLTHTMLCCAVLPHAALHCAQ